ncbi:reverse transcriptase domain-containing protein [Tanacetum coccineum]
MPLSIWKELNLPALTKTRMILELADRTISTPTSIADDVFIKVGTFFFPADFVVVDYVADPRAPLILGWQSTSTSGIAIDSRSPSFTPSDERDFLIEEIDAFLEQDVHTTGFCEINVPEEIKSSCEDPPDLELKDLPSHLGMVLEGDGQITSIC